MFQNTINALFKFAPMIDTMFSFLLKYIYILKNYSTVHKQCEINKIRKYKMGHINKTILHLQTKRMQFVVLQKKKKRKKNHNTVWCNTDKERKLSEKVKTLHNIM